MHSRWSLDRVDLEATTLWTKRLTAIVTPSDALENNPRLIVRHALNGAQREPPCGCGEKERDNTTTVQPEVDPVMLTVRAY
jgi:hypothetical protein